jgi:hypothetical protein
MKRKTPPISKFIKLVASSSNSTAENNNLTEHREVTEQPTTHNNSNPDPIDM